MKDLNELRGDRLHSMNTWRAGGDGNRWPGDDGRALTEMDLLRLRVDVLEGNATPLQQTIVTAEKDYFTDRDAVFEAGKSALVARGQNP